MSALAYVGQHPLARPNTRANAHERLQAARQQHTPEQLDAIEQRAIAYAPEHPSALLALFS